MIGHGPDSSVFEEASNSAQVPAKIADVWFDLLSNFERRLIEFCLFFNIPTEFVVVHVWIHLCFQADWVCPQQQPAADLCSRCMGWHSSALQSQQEVNPLVFRNSSGALQA